MKQLRKRKSQHEQSIQSYSCSCTCSSNCNFVCTCTCTSSALFTGNSSGRTRSTVNDQFNQKLKCSKTNRNERNHGKYSTKY